MSHLLLKPNFLMPVDKLKIKFNNLDIIISTKRVKSTIMNEQHLVIRNSKIYYIPNWHLSRVRYPEELKLLYLATICLDVEKGIIKNIHNPI